MTSGAAISAAVPLQSFSVNSGYQYSIERRASVPFLDFRGEGELE